MIISIIRAEYSGAWWALFHTAGSNYKFLATGHLLTAEAYEAVRAAFATEEAPEAAPASAREAAPLTPEERKRNTVRAKAEAQNNV